MFGIGMPELILIMAIALIVIGPKKLPDLARSLGRAMGELKKATGELKSSLGVDEELGDVKQAFDEMNKDIKDAVDVNPLDSIKSEFNASPADTQTATDSDTDEDHLDSNSEEKTAKSTEPIDASESTSDENARLTPSNNTETLNKTPDNTATGESAGGK